MLKKHYIFALFYVLLLNGCATPPKQTIPKDLVFDYKRNQSSLFADLEKNDDRWELVNINSDAGDILLNHLSPANIVDSHDKECSRGFFGLTSGDCRYLNNEWYPYRYSKKNLANPIIWPLAMALASVIMPMAYVGNIFVDDDKQGDIPWEDFDSAYFGIHFSPVFDAEKYRSAISSIEQDLTNKDVSLNVLTNNYSSLIIEFESYDQTASLESNLPELKDRTEQILKEFNQANESFLNENLNFQLIDKSQLFSKSMPNKKFLIEPIISSPVTPPEYKEASLTDLKRKDICVNDMFPSNDIATFKQKLIQATDCFEDLKHYNDQAHHQNSQAVLSTNQLNKFTYSTFRKQLEITPVQVNWERKKGADYLLKNTNHRLELPKSFMFNSSIEFPEIKANLIINSIDFNNVFPKTVKAVNNHLSATYNNSAVNLKNLSQDKIRPISFSFKVNDSKIDKSISEILEEDDTYRIVISRDDVFSLQQSYPGLTKTKATNIFLTAELSIVYKLEGDNETKTLFSTEKINLIDLLD
ncbi:MAG: hypothetical protein ACJAS1_004411 [Oleiphilaceae bacterium]|jgi:hypothetical protein